MSMDTIVTKALEDSTVDPYKLARQYQTLADLINYRLDSRAFYLYLQDKDISAPGLDRQIKNLTATAQQLRLFWKEIRALNLKLTSYELVRLGALSSGPGYAGDTNELHE